MEPKLTELDILFQQINKELMPKFKGKIIAIDANSGSYFIGNSELEAYKNAIKKYPNKKFVFKRIGFQSTHFVGDL